MEMPRHRERNTGQDRVRRSIPSPMPGSLRDLHTEACKTCLLNCSSLHHYTAPQCPVGTCDPCKALAALDVEIADLESRLAKCADRRRDLKTTINGHHNRLIRHFPFEITSQIFKYVVEDSDDDPRYLRSSAGYLGKPVLVLGAVCRSWREITVKAPELWSKVTIDLWKLGSDECFEVIKEFVARSRSLPLFARINAPEPPNSVDVQTQSQAMERVLSIMDPQFGRWKGLHLDSTPDSIRALFNKFSRFPELDSLQVKTMVPQGTRGFTAILAPPAVPIPEPALPLTVPRDLNSKALVVTGYSFLADVPLRCDRLTRLDANMIGANELLYVIKNAPNLRSLRMNNITRMNNLQDFPVPTARIECKSLTRLDGETCLFTGLLRFLTVPALQTLTHTFLTANVEFDGFLDCLHRSKFRHLTHLSLVYQTMEPRTPYMDGEGWYGSIPSLTHFRVKISNIVNHMGEERLDIVKGLTSPLDSHRQPLAFPLLQDLRISAPLYSRESWSLLYNVLRPGGIDGMTRVRPLQSVAVRASNGYGGLDTGMNDADRLGFIREMERSGVELDFRVNGECVDLRHENFDLSGFRPRLQISEEEMDDDF